MACAGALHAQQVLGPSTDATVLPRGVLRVTVAPTWSRYHERFADGLGSAKRGGVEPLARDYQRDSLGASVIPLLGPVGVSLQGLLGTSSGPALSLGRLDSRFDASVARTPIVVDYGLTRRIMLTAVLPLMRTYNEVSLVPNAGGTTGTMGVNPSFTSASTAAQIRGINQTVAAELGAAISTLQQRLQACVGSTAVECTAINGDRAGALALVTAASNAVAGIESVYGVSANKPGARFAPWQGGAVHQAVLARLTNLSTTFRAFLGAPNGSQWVAARPVGAPALGFADLQRIVTDTAFGVGADSLISVALSRPGDVEVGAKFLLIDTFGQQAQEITRTTPGVRVALGLRYRLGTGLRDSVDQFGSLGTGDGQSDLEGSGVADFVLNRRLWASVAARYSVQQADELTRRVPAVPHDPFPGDRRLVRRDLGDVLEVEVSPRLVVSRNLGLSGTWTYFHKGVDTYSATGTSSVANLGLGSEQRSQTALVSITYSNMAQYFRGRARTPLEISLSAGRVLSGEGNVPKPSISALTVRMYNRLF